MIIECTKKLADVMKIKLPNFALIEREPFYEWHANIFLFNRRKGVILMNNQTRYCIVLYGLKGEHFKNFNSIVLAAIEETFAAEGIAADKIKGYIKHCKEMVYTKTHNRSILGQINEFHLAISWEIEYHLPNNNVNMVELNKWVNNTQMCGAMGYCHPIDLLKKEIERIDTIS